MTADIGGTRDTARPAAPERRVFLAGTTIFKEGDPADVAYILEVGTVQIFKMVNGRRVRLADVANWGLFGELGILDDSPRMAAAYVTEDATCIVISKEVITRMLDGVPEGMFTLIQSLVKTIRTTGNDLAQARYDLLEREKSP
jgi:CRP-like cAMP-binding protein